MISNNKHLISFSILDCIINVTVKSAHLGSVLQKIYGNMQIPVSESRASLEYEISVIEGEVKQMKISRSGRSDLVTDDLGEFIFFFEKDMTIELQKIRSDLLFIHSAVLEYQGQGLLLVAPSGTGKSTTSWAMLNSNFNYLSDELAPVNLQSMQVEPYPHALCLKAVPPIFELPDDSLHTSHTIHVPIKYNGPIEPVKLSYILYLEFDKNITEAEIQPVTTAEAAAKLYTNSLNILAHANGENGLQAAISVAKKVKNYNLKSNLLDKTCEQLKVLLSSGIEN
jgi:ABC-type dipeptide/oligopeptide/nickel transport system ATPase subunit